MRYRKRQKAFVIFLFILLFILLSALIYTVLNSKNNTAILSPIEGIIKLIEVDSELSKITSKHFSKEEGGWAIYIKNLKTGESYGYNSDKQFDSASLYKIWVLAVALDQINKGRLSKTEILSAEKEKLDEVLTAATPTPTPEETPDKQNEEQEEKEVISIAAGDAIEKMITISDNYSALLVSDRVGARNIGDFLDEYGFNNSDYGSPPRTTAKDIASYFELLYKGKIIDKQTSEDMIEILNGQTLNDRIPKYLPQALEVAHKTGELFGNKHDAGIVFGENGDYIIVVMSKTESETEAAEKIAKFSREIYDYFN